MAKQYSLPIAGRRADIKEVESKSEDLEKDLNHRSSEFRNQQSLLQIKMPDVQKNLQHNEAAIEFVRFSLNNNKQGTDSTMYAAYIIRKNESIPVFVPLCEEKQLQQLFASAGNTTTAVVGSFYRGAGAED